MGLKFSGLIPFMELKIGKRFEYLQDTPWVTLAGMTQGYPCLYYNPMERWYIVNYFLQLEAVIKKHKFGKEAVKSLTDHPHHILETHKCSSKHQKSKKEHKKIM